MASCCHMGEVVETSSFERTGIGGRLSTIDRMRFQCFFHEKGYEQNILSLPCQTQVSNLSAMKWKLVSDMNYDVFMKLNPKGK